MTGGAGFLGSNLVSTILQRKLGSVTIFDNFLTGRREYLQMWRDSPDLAIITADVGDFGATVGAIRNHDVVFHLAANSDIARAVVGPLVDFDNGTKLTQTLLEGMRTAGVRRIIFSSGSGVYGDVPPTPIPEDYTPMIPISTYGASKLASEALISAYCHMFDLTATVFRFANVVGPHMTHGVTHDFTRRLRADGSRLHIYGRRQPKQALYSCGRCGGGNVAHRVTSDQRLRILQCRIRGSSSCARNRRYCCCRNGSEKCQVRIQGRNAWLACRCSNLPTGHKKNPSARLEERKKLP